MTWGPWHRSLDPPGKAAGGSLGHSCASPPAASPLFEAKIIYLPLVSGHVFPEQPQQDVTQSITGGSSALGCPEGCWHLLLSHGRGQGDLTRPFPIRFGTSPLTQHRCPTDTPQLGQAPLGAEPPVQAGVTSSPPGDTGVCPVTTRSCRAGGGGEPGQQERGSNPILGRGSRPSFTYRRPRGSQARRAYPISLSYVTDLLFINRSRHLLRGFSRGFAKVPL